MSAPPDGDAWEQVGVLLERALALPSERRSAFLDHTCGPDTPLRRELDSLLAASEGAEAFFGEMAGSVVSPAWAALGAAGSSDPRVGRVVSHYEVLDTLGAGGMGVVYRARDLRLDREVALKFLPAALSREPRARALLLREARAAAALDDPHVCAIHGVEETPDGDVFLVMPCYRGETLREAIARGPLPVGRACDVAARIARGLAHAHAHGVVHRDLKPGNVMLTADGGVVLLDFGLARLRGAAASTRSAAFGTVGYMAPEQVRAGPVDARADVWALGVIVHEMLSGERPFGGESEAAVLHAILHADPPPLRGLRDDVSPALEALVGRMLSRDPARRPADGAEALAAFSAAAAGEPGRGGRASARRRRRGWRVAAVVAVVGAAAGGAALALLPRAGGLPAGAPPGTMEAVAVLPFTVRGDEELAFLHEGLVDLLGHKLDGVAGLHTLDANAVLSHPAVADGRPVGPARGRQVAAGLGATHFVLGSVVRVGEGIQLSAALYEAGGREVARAQARVTGEGQILGGIDALAQGLVSTRLRDPDEQLAGLAAMTTPSYPALRAFLQGERLLREGRPDAALADLRRAVALDSTFAIAWYRLARAAGWTGDDALNAAATGRALRHVDGLPHRAREVVEAYAVFRTGDPAEAERRYRSIVAMHPDDAETWLLLGELLFHNNPAFGRPLAEAREPLQRALALDPDNREVLVHLMDLAARDGRLADLDSLGGRYLGAGTGGERPGMRAAYAALRAVALGGPGALDSAAAGLRRAGPDALLTALVRVAPHLDGPAPGERFAALLAEPSTTPPLRVVALHHAATFAVARGRWDRAERSWAEAAALAPAGTRVQRALAHSLPFSPASDSLLASLRAELLAWDLAREPLEDGAHAGELDVVRDYLVGRVSGRAGDEVGAAASADRLRAVEGTDGRAVLARSLAGRLDALAAWRRGDGEAALAALDRAELRVPFHVRARSPVLVQPLEGWLRAEAHRAAGRAEEGRRWDASLRESGHNAAAVFRAAP